MLMDQLCILIAVIIIGICACVKKDLIYIKTVKKIIACKNVSCDCSLDHGDHGLFCGSTVTFHLSFLLFSCLVLLYIFSMINFRMYCSII